MSCRILILIVIFSACSTAPISDKPVQYLYNGLEYLRNGQCEDAEQSCRLALEYGTGFKEAHNCLGLVDLQCRNDLASAALHFKDALSIDGDFAEAHNNLGLIFFRRDPPDYAAAIEELEAALEIDPGFMSARENLAMVMVRQGKIAGDLGDRVKQAELFTAARAQLVRLIQQAPDNVEARHHLGFIALEQRDYPAAEASFLRCLGLAPQSPMCCYNLGHVYLATARCDQAIAQFVCASRPQVDPTIAVPARKNLGVAYTSCAAEDGALATYVDAIARDPTNPVGHYDLGNIYAKKGMFDRATTAWESATRLDPTYCPPYDALSAIADRNLDTPSTIQHCRSYVACMGARAEASVERCKELVRKLEME